MASEPGFRFLALLVIVLSLAGLTYGHRWGRGLQTKLEESRAEEDKRLAAYKKKVLELEAHDRLSEEEKARDTTFVVPPSWAGDDRLASTFAISKGARCADLTVRPTTLLAIGQSDLLPWLARVTLKQRDDLFEAQEFSSEEIVHPAHLRAGHFDYAFVIVYLLPLLIIGWTYNFLSGEKETGRWGLLMAQAGAVRPLLLRRLICRWGVFSAIACGALFLGAGALGGWRSPGSMGMAAVLVTSYSAFWFGLSFWINSRDGASAFNAVSLASAWLLVVLILPQASSIGADVAAPAPSRLHHQQTLRDITNATYAKDYERLNRFYLEHSDYLRESKLPDLKLYYNMFYAVQRIIDDAVLEKESTFAARLNRHEKAQAILNFFSPAVLVQEALSDIAGTHPSRHRRFKEQVLEYQRRMREILEPKIVARGLMTIPDVEALPAFVFIDNPAGAAGRRIWPILVLLAASCLLVASGAARLGGRGS